MNTYAERINKLRGEMLKEAVDAYIVPTADYHASEYVSEHFKDREYISGFTGSAGTLVVTREEALLYTDGRYFIQAEKELEGTEIKLMRMGEFEVPTIKEYLLDNMEEGSTLGYDGRTMDYRFGDELREMLEEKAISFKTDINLVDNLWKNRPEIPMEEVWILHEKYSGESSASKIERIREELKEQEVDGVLITALDDVAWLYNIRGNDIKYTPVTLSFAIITEDRAHIYIDSKKLSREVKAYFENNNITIRPYDSIYEDVKSFPGVLLVDPEKTNEKLARCVHSIKFGLSPVAEAKCIKNVTELENFKETHLKDGIALTKTIYWLKKKAETSSIFRETELSVSEHLNDERMSREGYISSSFESIVASNEHGAIVHYEPTEKSDKVIENGFLLIDSGGHYLTGTTDVTRTISIKEPDYEMKKYYTAVLKGHLSLGMAIFDKDAPTYTLDEIARKPLKEMGKDYNHGTGHGVGYALTVHEGPTGFRTQKATVDYPFKRHMVVSNEPGVYLENKFGIRIENLMYVEELDEKLRFVTLTLAPYDKASINIEELNFEELEDLRWYSEKVYTMLSPHLTNEEKMWLREETIY